MIETSDAHDIVIGNWFGDYFERQRDCVTSRNRVCVKGFIGLSDWSFSVFH